MFHLIFLCLIAGLSFLISYYITRFFIGFSLRQILKQFPSFDKKILRAAFTPVQFGFALVFFLIILCWVEVPENWILRIHQVALVLSAFILAWLVFNVVDLLGEWWTEYLRERGREAMIGMIPLLRRTSKILMFLLALITFLQNIGVHITALLAGIGVGGIAVALGAQKMIGDLIGGVMLVLEHSVRVGDECKFGGQQGQIEEIGVRTTRIRTAERSVIVIPNSDFAQIHIENLSIRDRIRLHCILEIHRNSTPDQIRFLLVEMRTLLYAHPKVDQDPARVRLVSVTNASLNLEISAYILTTQWGEFLGIREDLLLRFLDKIKEAGTSLAAPLMESIEPLKLDPFLAQQKVALWRSKNELPLPEFTEAQKEAVDDSLDYPPQGSVISF